MVLRMENLPTTDRPEASGGLALILVLWVLMLLTIMAGSFALGMKREISVVSNVKDMAQTSALAEAGINYAMMMLLHSSKEERWEADGSIYQIQFAGAKIRIMIVDEAGKININKPDQDLFRGALTNAGATEEEQDIIIDSIQDWQDSNDLIRLNGAEKDQYLDAGLNYGPSNKPFQVTDELQMVMGMNAELYEKLEPLLTVYSKQSSANLAKATKEVLMALPDVTEEAVNNYLGQRAENKKNGLPPPDFPFASGGKRGSSNVYTLISEAMLNSGITGKTKAVIKKGMSRRKLPFKILEWETTQISEESLFSSFSDELVIK